MITFECQSEAISSLKLLAENRRHSILISGVPGCGKTYLCSRFSEYVGSNDFVVVKPVVSDIRNTIEACYELDHVVVICIENLDLGVLGSSYALLKFLEEPRSNIYIVVTCRNENKIPDTIISRCSAISITPPSLDEIEVFAKDRDSRKYQECRSSKSWKSIRSFSDIQTIYSWSSDKLQYIDEVISLVSNRKLVKESVSNIIWKINHFPNDEEIPAEFILGSILVNISDRYLKSCILSCLTDLNQKRIATHAVLARFAFELKYGG